MPHGTLPLLLAIGTAKAIIFIIAFLIGLLSTPTTAEPGAATTRGGLFAIYSTLSDDIGLGVPVLGDLFARSASPAVAPLYVLSAMQASR